MVVFVTVSTSSIPMLKGTGQSLVMLRSIVPAEKVALVKFPRLPPLYVPTLVSFTDGKGATKLDTSRFEVLMPRLIASESTMFTDPVEPGL